MIATIFLLSISSSKSRLLGANTCFLVYNQDVEKNLEFCREVVLWHSGLGRTALGNIGRSPPAEAGLCAMNTAPLELT